MRDYKQRVTEFVDGIAADEPYADVTGETLTRNAVERYTAAMFDMADDFFGTEMNYGDMPQEAQEQLVDAVVDDLKHHYGSDA